MVSFSQLQEISGSVKIVLDKLAAASRAVDASEDARVCRRVQNPIDRVDGFQIAAGPNVGVNQFYTSFPQRFDIQVAASPTQIIEADNFQGRISIEQSMNDTAPSETADSGDEDFHLGIWLLGIFLGS
jgi:hypothetical protein